MSVSVASMNNNPNTFPNPTLQQNNMNNMTNSINNNIQNNSIANKIQNNNPSISLSTPNNFVQGPRASISNITSKESIEYPFNEKDAASDELVPSQSHQLYDSLLQLTNEIAQLANQDRGKIQGTIELSKRSKETFEILSSYNSYIQQQQLNEMVQSALMALHKTLFSAKIILNKALITHFRRSSKFKSPIRICVNDLVIGISKLGNSISLAYSVPVKSEINILKGQEECCVGDKYFYGHGCSVDYQKAQQWYRASVAFQYSPAFCSLAHMYREGIGMNKNIQEAIKLYKEASVLNNLDAINQLGILHESGLGVPRSLEIAIELYQQAANGGHLDAQCNLGYIYEHGSEDEHNYVPIDIDAARAWYEEAAEKGYSKAMNNLAYLYFTEQIHAQPEPIDPKSSNLNSSNSSTTQSSSSIVQIPTLDAQQQRDLDFKFAIKWFTSSAQLGNAGAQNNLGICYESGVNGVLKSEEIAIQYYLQASQQGHPSAQSSLGYLYLKQRHFQTALEWLEIASKNESSEADYHLAQMYHHGLYVTKNDEIAFNYYLKAADRGHSYAQLEVAHSLFSCRGCKKDIYKAFKYYNLSCQQGVSEAMNSLAILYEEGVATEIDFNKAKQYYEQAEQKGNQDAIYNLGLLYEKEGNQQKAQEKFQKAKQLGSQQASIKLTAS